VRPAFSVIFLTTLIGAMSARLSYGIFL